MAEPQPIDLTTLQTALAAVGKQVALLPGPDGTRILVLEHGGRVLGLFAPESQRNFLWTTRQLAAADSARAYFASPDWCNSGGDRTWLAPEVDFFLPRFPDTSAYFQQRALDPGAYRLQVSGNSARLTAEMTLQASRNGGAVHVRISKTITPAGGVVAGVPYSGYTHATTLELLAPSPQNAVGLWQLLQLPHGGEMLIPTRGRSAPWICFGTPADLRVEDAAVRWRMCAPGAQKISLRAAAATGRVGYAYRQGTGWSLVVREFQIDPAGLYVDVPWTDPADTGYAVQACNVSTPELGDFNELEYHAPAIGGATGGQRSTDVSRVWAFHGTREQITRSAAELLGCTPET